MLPRNRATRQRVVLGARDAQSTDLHGFFEFVAQTGLERLI